MVDTKVSTILAMQKKNCAIFSPHFASPQKTGSSARPFSVSEYSACGGKKSGCTEAIAKADAPAGAVRLYESIGG